MNKCENFIDGISLCKVKIPVRIRMDTFIDWVLKEVSSRPEHMPFGALLIKTFFVDEFIGKDNKKNNTKESLNFIVLKAFLKLWHGPTNPISSYASDGNYGIMELLSTYLHSET